MTTILATISSLMDPDGLADCWNDDIYHYYIIDKMTLTPSSLLARVYLSLDPRHLSRRELIARGDCVKIAGRANDYG